MNSLLDIMAEKVKSPVLDLGVDRYVTFKLWKEKWQDHVMLTDLDKKDTKYQAALLRYTFSDETHKIYVSLQLTEDQKDKPDEIIKALEKFAK